MGARTTIHDVAKAAGVSVSTVSKAVNGRYGIADATVQRVLDAVKDLGYESSLVASSMRARRTGVIGVLLADFEPFSAEILKGVGAAMHDTSFDLLAYSGSRHGAGDGWERRSLSRLSGTLIDAAIMVTPTVVGASTEIPVVAIDPHTGRADLPTVESDSFGGALAAVRHLIDLGHRRIGFLAGRPDLRSAGLREAGYRRALADAGIAFDPALVREGDWQVDSGYAHALALLDGPERPTALFCANDLMALGALDAARERKLAVPRELSVVGYDDQDLARYTHPPLTTVLLPNYEMGRWAAESLIAQARGGNVSNTVFKSECPLVSRESVAAPSV